MAVKDEPERTCITNGEDKTEILFVKNVEDRIILSVRSTSGGSWALRKARIMHAGLLAEYHELDFCAEKPSGHTGGHARIVLEDTAYSEADGYGWL